MLFKFTHTKQKYDIYICHFLNCLTKVFKKTPIVFSKLSNKIEEDEKLTFKAK